MSKSEAFLDYFPGHKYRYIDQTGEGRPPVCSNERQDLLNKNGYESYFTVNGFADANDNTKEQCTNLNAFFCDIDGRKDKEELEEIKKRLDPTFILETKNGHHIYWALDEHIYKEDFTEEEWLQHISRWEDIEQRIVVTLKADLVVKDVTRILRVPDTFYWKKTGDAYKVGTGGVFKIKGVYKKLANRYPFTRFEEAFPPLRIEKESPFVKQTKEYAESERRDFFRRVNDDFPIVERTSFKKLISGSPSTYIGNSRNTSLLITATLMKQAGWDKKKAFDQIDKVGWHGLEKDKGGMQEIVNTINSAYGNDYTYSYKHDVIANNMDDDEQAKIQDAFQVAHKARKERNKLRFSTYEKEILVRHPYLRKNAIGMFFNYESGVYKMMSDQDMSSMILNALDEDMLADFRTKKHVADKLACLVAIAPDLTITPDGGRIVNLKNGLLDIYTRELKPHTPEYVSLSQSPISYAPETECPNWIGCLQAWMDGPESEEKTKILQQFSGYCLSSSMTYDKALFLIGDGGNGKSTFVDTISLIIGKDSTSHIDLEDLYRQFGMRGLIGMRLNVIEEVHGNYYQSNKLKKLISGEMVTIDQKFKEQFTFRPQAKFIFAVNIMPRVDDTSTATERRISAVVFRNNFRTFPNVNLRGEAGLLAQEASGVLNWMLDGANMLNEMKSFVSTKEQIALLREYRQENSAVEAFIEDCLDFEEGRLIDARELYDNYKEYCAKDGRKFKAKISFTKEMKAYGSRHNKFGFIERNNSGSSAKFEGVAINADWKRASLTHSFEHYGND